MKRAIPLVLLACIFIFTYLFKDTLAESYNNWVKFSYCEETITYSIENIDPQFNVSKQTVLEDTKNAADIWNNAANFEIFRYDPQGTLKISLVFDERQRLLNRLNVMEENVGEKEAELTMNIADFESQRSVLEKKINELNQEIEYWNSRGGADPEKYEELINRQNEVRSESEQLNKIAVELNKNTSEINSQIDTLNNTAVSFNNLLETKPEEGLYISGEGVSRIAIYFYDNKIRFTHTMAHEMGHAIGLGHVDDINSIMYPTTTESLELSALDRQLLNNYCKEQDKIEIFKHEIQLALRELGSIWSENFEQLLDLAV